MLALLLLSVIPLLAWADAGPDTDYPLIFSVWNDDFAAVQNLLKAGANPNKHDSSQNIALCQVKSVKMLKLLLQYGAKVNTVDGAKRSGIMVANGDAVVRAFAEAGADLNLVDISGSDVLGNIVSWDWVSVDLVKYLINKGCDASYGNENGNGAIFSAAFYNYARIAKVLMDNGADPNQKDSDGKTPYQVAAERGNAEVMAVLKAGMKPGNLAVKVTFDEESISQAVLSGNYAKLDSFFKQGLDVNSVVYGASLLHTACINQGDLKMVKFLVSKGADLNALNQKTGNTALMDCLTSIFPDDIYPVCVYLIEQGTDLTITNDNGQNLQGISKVNGNTKLYQKLLPIIKKAQG